MKPRRVNVDLVDRRTKALVGALEFAKDRLETLVDAEAATPLDVECLRRIYRSLDMNLGMDEKRETPTPAMAMLRESAPPALASPMGHEKARAR